MTTDDTPDWASVRIPPERRERLRDLLADLAALETLPGLAEAEPLPSFAPWDGPAEASGDA